MDRDVISVSLPVRPPYDWSSVLRFFEARAIRGIETIASGRYARTVDVAGVHGTLSVEPAAGDALRASIRIPAPSAVPAIITRLTRMFDVDADPDVIGAHLAQDALLAPLVHSRPGLRVPGGWDGFELAVRAVLGQQITVKAAASLAARLVSAYGKPLLLAGAPLAGLTHVFPRPEALAPADVASLGMPRSRAGTVNAVAAAFAADPELVGVERDRVDLLARLRGIPGVGEWTVQYIAMRALRDPDAFPAQDVALQRALTGCGPQRPTAREAAARAERWRPWRAYAAQHLWTASASPQADAPVGGQAP